MIENGAARGVLTAGGFLAADAVVCATDSHDAARIIPNLSERVATFLTDMNYSSCCHVVLAVDCNPIDGGYFHIFQTKGTSFLDCYLDSAVLQPGAAPPGKGLIHAYIAEEKFSEFVQLDDEEITRRVTDEIRRYSPRMPANPIFSRIYRWKRAVCLPPGGAMRKLDTLRSEGFPSVDGLFMAGEYLSLISCMNGGIKAGIAAAKEADRYFTRSVG